LYYVHCIMCTHLHSIGHNNKDDDDDDDVVSLCWKCR